jgi:hypothetical protein
VACLLIGSAWARAELASAQQSTPDVAALLDRAGERVRQFFTRAQQLVCVETVVLQPVRNGLTPSGFSRTVVSELRLTWEPAADGHPTQPRAVRQVLRVNDRLPRKRDRNACNEPEQQTTEEQPLSLLLGSERMKYAFSLSGTDRVGGRETTTVNFRELAPVSTTSEVVPGIEDCISYEITGGRQGRLWIDASSGEILRLDLRSPTMVDIKVPDELARRSGTPAFLTQDRSETTIRFERVHFRDPDEDIMLPVRSVQLRQMRGGGQRTTTTYTDYQRYLTEGRMLSAEPLRER